ncbi:hypothetical protein STEG23_037922 [Scotinomys teguina]
MTKYSRWKCVFRHSLATPIYVCKNRGTRVKGPDLAQSVTATLGAKTVTQGKREPDTGAHRLLKSVFGWRNVFYSGTIERSEEDKLCFPFDFILLILRHMNEMLSLPGKERKLSSKGTPLESAPSDGFWKTRSNQDLMVQRSVFQSPALN